MWGKKGTATHFQYKLDRSDVTQRQDLGKHIAADSPQQVRRFGHETYKHLRDHFTPLGP